jgi:predicted Zn-dependent protease
MARLMRVLRKGGQPEEAGQFVNVALQKAPDNPFLLSQASSLLGEVGKHAEALIYGEAALRALPGDPNMRGGHAMVLARAVDHEAAFEMFVPLLESEKPPCDAVVMFSNISHLFDTKAECRRRLDVISTRPSLTGEERRAIQRAQAVLDAS